MIPKVVEAKPLAGYRLWVKFSDGLTGIVELEDELWGSIFEPLKNISTFSQVYVDPELETVAWPNGADFAPEFLYGAVAHTA